MKRLKRLIKNFPWPIFFTSFVIFMISYWTNTHDLMAVGIMGMLCSGIVGIYIDLEYHW